MSGWPDGEQQLGSQTRDHSNPQRFLYIGDAMEPLVGFNDHDETLDRSFALQSQPGLDHDDVAAGSLQDGGHHGPGILAHPTPRYAINPEFYTAWSTSQPPYLPYSPAAHAESCSMRQLDQAYPEPGSSYQPMIHAESSSIHQFDQAYPGSSYQPVIHAESSSMHHLDQAYPEPGSSHQPMIEPPTLDLALFDNPVSSSQFSVTVESSDLDDVTRYKKIARSRGKANGVRPILKNAKRVGMERAQFSRKVEANASSAAAQGSSRMSSELGAKIVPGAGVRKLLELLREGMKIGMFKTSILPPKGSLSKIVDATWKDVADSQFSRADWAWAQEMLNDKKYVDEKMGPVFDEISQEMTEAARFFTYHYCRVDFDDVAVVVEQLAINNRAKRLRGLVKDDAFLYGQLSVDGVDLGTIAFTSEIIIRMVRYLLRDGPHQYHKYISQGNFGPLLIMTATVCRWALQEHGTGFFVKSQFLPEENTEHYTHYHAIFEGLDPRVLAALTIQITSTSALTPFES